jgi:hypothetical protein
MTHFKIPGTVRASFAFTIQQEEIDLMVEAIKRIKCFLKTQPMKPFRCSFFFFAKDVIQKKQDIDTAIIECSQYSGLLSKDNN